MNYTKTCSNANAQFIFLLIFLILTTTTAFGAVIKVPKDYSTIQTGIDVASDGDTVLVADGIYTGFNNKNLDFNGKAITVRSENGPEKSIIDCENYGRGFYFHSLEFESSVISGFTIRNGNMDKGGGIFITNASPTVTNCIISENTANSSRGGGGIYCENSFPIITNCTISNNTGYNLGGGIGCRDSSPFIANCKIIANESLESNGRGGGIHLQSVGTTTITNSIISDNRAKRGGGIYANSSTSLSISFCDINGNMASVTGGGIYLGSGSRTISNCIISNNTVLQGSGGGIYCYHSSPAIINCTFSENRASNTGGGMDLLSSSPTITNCIFWNDLPNEIDEHSNNPIVTFSNIQGGFAGTGNIDVDPLFLGGGDYHLTAVSPCIDTGTAEELSNYDIDGDLRPHNDRYDMGADEYSDFSPTLNADFVVNPTRGLPPLNVYFTERSSGFITTWYWDFGDGTISTLQNAPSHTFTELKNYIVSLTVTGPAGSNRKLAYVRVGYPAESKAMPWIPLLLLDD
jgi:parallel beta-helix repeat protein